MIIDYATGKDESHIYVYDKKHIQQEQLAKAIDDKRVYVAKESNIVLGFARYNLFWDSIPFLNLLYVPDGYRHMGIGIELLRFWENDMKKKGNEVVLTSTMSNEKAQHFFRKHGYVDVGNLYFENEGLELILRKKL